MIGDYYDMQFRIGYHPGVKVYVTAATTAAAATCSAPGADS